ncbi:hypothetical protein NL676_031079 [Syzygium grande]|nr:hypothetical protein NL676_031079 [Syzygium grande]
MRYPMHHTQHNLPSRDHAFDKTHAKIQMLRRVIFADRPHHEKRTSSTRPSSSFGVMSSSPSSDLQVTIDVVCSREDMWGWRGP